MPLDLPDDETAALTRELHDMVENDRDPFSHRTPTSTGYPRPAGTGDGSRSVAAGEGLCATAGEKMLARVKAEPGRQ
jgi:hypothetical protein